MKRSPEKKAFYKKGWFWTFLVALMLIFAGGYAIHQHTATDDNQAAQEKTTRKKATKKSENTQKKQSSKDDDKTVKTEADEVTSPTDNNSTNDQAKTEDNNYQVNENTTPSNNTTGQTNQGPSNRPEAPGTEEITEPNAFVADKVSGLYYRTANWNQIPEEIKNNAQWVYYDYERAAISAGYRLGTLVP